VIYTKEVQFRQRQLNSISTADQQVNTTASFSHTLSDQILLR